MDYYIFFVKVPNIDEGTKIANILVESRLVACVNIIQKIFSIYRWKGSIEKENELLLIIKTTEHNCDLLIQKVREIHSYSNPECVGFKIDNGTEKYFNWIKEVVD
ncbi:MAG: divalent-cation tolerance protein CutA [Candidatus Lokiarchaeota archaeon]|nr:divalent-cation tolerance protein CutA [Candidatus Lokiarchaeota archaeon]